MIFTVYAYICLQYLCLWCLHAIYMGGIQNLRNQNITKLNRAIRLWHDSSIIRILNDSYWNIIVHVSVVSELNLRTESVWCFEQIIERSNLKKLIQTLLLHSMNSQKHRSSVKTYISVFLTLSSKWDHIYNTCIVLFCHFRAWQHSFTFIILKIDAVCSSEIQHYEKKSYRFGMTWGWINN